MTVLDGFGGSPTGLLEDRNPNVGPDDAWENGGTKPHWECSSSQALGPDYDHATMVHWACVDPENSTDRDAEMEVTVIVGESSGPVGFCIRRVQQTFWQAVISAPDFMELLEVGSSSTTCRGWSDLETVDECGEYTLEAIFEDEDIEFTHGSTTLTWGSASMNKYSSIHGIYASTITSGKVHKFDFYCVNGA